MDNNHVMCYNLQLMFVMDSAHVICTTFSRKNGNYTSLNFNNQMICKHLEKLVYVMHTFITCCMIKEIKRSFPPLLAIILFLSFIHYTITRIS